MNIQIEEQGLRDGIQNLDQTITTSKKLEIIDELINAGVRRLQVASFVHPRLVPQMADAEELISKLPSADKVLFSGLVLNMKGVERAIDSGIKHISCSISASNSHSQKNTRMTLAEAKESFALMIKAAKAAGLKVRGGIQCAFGCRYEGEIAEQQVLDLVDHHLEFDIDEIALADSTGMGNPVAVKRVMTEVVNKANGKLVALHLHNTENKGYANVYAALDAGVRILDTAIGGLGGCPFIKSATGNISTEDTVHMLDQMGIETGIDWKKIAEISNKMEALLGQKLPSKMYGLAKEVDIKIT